MVFSEFCNYSRKAVTKGFLARLSVSINLPANDVMQKRSALPGQLRRIADAQQEFHVYLICG